MNAFQELLARARAGDADAVDALMRRSLEPLRAFVRLRTGPRLRARESCSDLVQSACREALGELGELDCGDEGAFRAWLCAVALNKIRSRANYHAAEKRDANSAVELDAAGGDATLLGAYASVFSPSRDAAANEEVQRLEAAFDGLEDADRELILQLRVLERTHRDVAAELGKSEVAVRKALSRALARLALRLTGPRSGGGSPPR